MALAIAWIRYKRIRAMGTFDKRVQQQIMVAGVAVEARVVHVLLSELIPAGVGTTGTAHVD